MPTRTPEPLTRVIPFLEKTLWGESVRYRIRDLASSLSKLPPHEFLERSSPKSFDAVLLLLRKEVSILHRPLKALYLTFFSVDPAKQGQGLGTSLLRQALQYAEKENIDVAYAYIESDNVRSLQAFKKAGFQSVREFKAVVLSRYAPQPSAKASPLRPDEKEPFTSILEELYRSHALRDFEASLDPSCYWVIRDAHGVVAGVQVSPQSWTIQEMKGPDGCFLKNLWPRLPGLGRMFQPENCRFLKLGNLYARPGHEKALMELIEDQMARHRVHLALTYADPSSPLYRRMQAIGGLGLLHAVMQFPITLSVLPLHLTTAETSQLRAGPLVLSPLDIG